MSLVLPGVRKTRIFPSASSFRRVEWLIPNSNDASLIRRRVREGCLRAESACTLSVVMGGIPFSRGSPGRCSRACSALSCNKSNQSTYENLMESRNTKDSRSWVPQARDAGLSLPTDLKRDRETGSPCATLRFSSIRLTHRM